MPVALATHPMVVLLAGNGHVDRKLGVPQHLRADLKAKSIQLRAGDAATSESADAFDAVWPTPALAETDHCDRLRKQFAPRSGSGAAAKP